MSHGYNTSHTCTHTHIHTMFKLHPADDESLARELGELGGCEIGEGGEEEKKKEKDGGGREGRLEHMAPSSAQRGKSYSSPC